MPHFVRHVLKGRICFMPDFVWHSKIKFATLKT